jgi:hypothetical protein
MSGAQPEPGLGGHQRARRLLPDANLQPLLEVILVGTRHPLRSEVAQVGRDVSDAGGPEAGPTTPGASMTYADADSTRAT